MLMDRMLVCLSLAGCLSACPSDATTKFSVTCKDNGKRIPSCGRQIGKSIYGEFSLRDQPSFAALLVGENANISQMQLNAAPRSLSGHSDDPWFGKDKIDHFLASAFLACMSYTFLRDELDFNKKPALAMGFGCSVSFGVAKELRDKWSKKGVASIKDLVWDLIGAGIGILICN